MARALQILHRLIATPRDRYDVIRLRRDRGHAVNPSAAQHLDPAEGVACDHQLPQPIPPAPTIVKPRPPRTLAQARAAAGVGAAVGPVAERPAARHAADLFGALRHFRSRWATGYPPASFAPTSGRGRPLARVRRPRGTTGRAAGSAGTGARFRDRGDSPDGAAIRPGRRSRARELVDGKGGGGCDRRRCGGRSPPASRSAAPGSNVSVTRI
jgi:hypothetical protein